MLLGTPPRSASATATITPAQCSRPEAQPAGGPGRRASSATAASPTARCPSRSQAFRSTEAAAARDGAFELLKELGRCSGGLRNARDALLIERHLPDDLVVGDAFDLSQAVYDQAGLNGVCIDACRPAPVCLRPKRVSIGAGLVH